MRKTTGNFLQRLIVRHQPKVGASPGVLPPSTTNASAKVRVLSYTQASVSEHDGNWRDITTSPSPGVRWIDVVGVDDTSTMRALGDQVGIHPLALEDAVHVPQRPKTDEYDDAVFMVLKMPDKDGVLEQVSLFVRQGLVVTFQERDGDCFEPVRKRVRNPQSRLRQRGSDYLTYALLDATVDSFFPLLDRLGTRLDEMERRLEGNAGVDEAREIQSIRRDVFRLRREVAPMREALRAFSNEDASILTEATRPYVRDCEDHANQLLDDLDTCREMGSALMDLHQSESNQRLNEVMKVLTIISTIFIPLSFVAGLYGMNFEASPWNMPELRWRYGYPATLALMSFIAVGLLGFFRHKGWLGRSARKVSSR